MNPRFNVSEFSENDLVGEIDAFICSIGYESRSTFAAKQYSNTFKRCFGIVFPERQVGNFSLNTNWCEKNSFSLYNYDDLSLDTKITDFINDCFLKRENTKNQFRIVIDISSMTRRILAQVFLAICKLDISINYTVLFIYSPSIYSPPSSIDVPVTISEPVIPEFAGWTTRPELPPVAVVGLGYEHGQALGTIEYLEPGEAWLFIPKGKFSSFDNDVKSANAELIESIDSRHIYDYSLHDPFSCFCILESLIFGLKQDHRPILIPFGPKIFALISLIIAYIHKPDVIVWRVSGEQMGDPIDREPDGSLIGLTLNFLEKN